MEDSFGTITDKLIIISVPFKRNARYLLSSEVYIRLKENHRILIVCSFDISKMFKAEFGGLNVEFYESDLSHTKSKFYFLYNLSELLRMNGYKFRYRNNSLKHQWFESTSILYNNGIISKKSSRGKFIAYLSGILGYYRKSWKYFDVLFGRNFYNTDKLMNIANAYKSTVIIQTANFGYQERFLSYIGSLLKSKLIMLPYTTDQICINGYLISKYDSICVQGSVEEKYLLKFHNIESDKIFNMGSLWFRNIESICTENNYGIMDNYLEKKKTVLYAGLSSTYFNRKIELKAIDRILQEIKQGELNNCKLIYRPVATNLEINLIIDKYRGVENFEIQKPQASMIGMVENSVEVVIDDIKNYIEDLKDVDVVVVSQLTTLLWDGVFLNKPGISYMVNETDFDQKRNELFVDSDPCEIYLSGVPVIFNSLDKLINQIKKYIIEPELVLNIKEKVLSRWDTKNDDYVKEFMLLVETNLNKKK